MKVSKVYLLALLTAFIFCGCEEDQPNLVPVFVPSVEGTLGGDPWEASIAQAIFTLNTVEFTALGVDSSAILFVIVDEGVGTYTLPDAQNEYASYLPDNTATNEFLVNAQNGSGTIRLTEIDDAEGLCSGNFELTLVNPNTNEEIEANCQFRNIPISR